MGYKRRQLFSAFSIDYVHTMFLADYDKNFNFAGEVHNMWEIGCVRAGKMGITSGTEIYECGANELFIHPTGVFHKAWAKEENVKIFTVSFSGIGIERFVPTGKFILNKRERMLIELLESETVKDADNIGIEHNHESEQIVKNLLETLCLSLNRRKSESAAPDTRGRGTQFAQVANYLAKNVDMAITVEDICCACAIGRTALKKLFNTYAGIGVIKYYNILRTRRAIGMIEEGHSMAYISETMHFSSQNYFSDFFKRETGITPTKYLKV